ncbi:class C sortase, partial [Streptococcus pyogenes]
KRLLVRGHRIAFHYKKYQQAKKAMKLVDKSRMWTEIVCAAFGVVIAIVLVFMYSKMTDKKVIKN